MQSIKNVYKIGYGPSSSHTMGPEKAVKIFREKFSDLEKVCIHLYDSLALTGKGHLTDYVIEKALKGIETEIIWEPKIKMPKHENSMEIIGYLKSGKIEKWTVYSIGGGDIQIDEYNINKNENIELYKEQNMNEINKYCQENNLTYLEYIQKNEIILVDYLYQVWEVMQKSIENGINSEGIIPGKLKVKKRAKQLYQTYLDNLENKDLLLNSYAYAVNEENASGGLIVTAPTCGACGTLPAILKYYQDIYKVNDEKIIEALAVAGLFGLIVKNNATISGAEAGCQAEVGVATSMAAAALMYLEGGDNHQIESAAEIGLEHQIGLTCDPVLGYVQIPCIQRNAVAAVKAKNATMLAKNVSQEEQVDFDTIVEVMYETGKDLRSEYRETSLGGLAKYFKNK